ncbi:MAG: ribonuclease R [Paracoccaceae bacterium]
MAKIPSKDQILEWIGDNPTKTSKRDIAKAFGIKGAARIDLKRLLKELEVQGHLQKRKRTYRDPDQLPPVSVLSIAEPNADGDLFAQPAEWQGEGAAPLVFVIQKSGDPALGNGDRILARLTKVKEEEHAYEARLIRRIGTNPIKVLGIFRKAAEGGRIVPIDKGADREWRVAPGATHGAKDGELVEAEHAGPKDRMGVARARIVARLGDPSQPRAVSLIAIHQHGLRDAFPDEAIAEADAMVPADLNGREDLRDVPLVTIDPADARDHDDAVLAEADPDPKNKGGFILWVAIADVAHYIRTGSALDREAWERGNSTYFPDRVVPMLPDRLSGDLCSLHEGVERACLVAKMRINAKGEMIDHAFLRGLMKSAASLHYDEVQAAIDGAANDKTAPLMEGVLAPLYAAYEALKIARAGRQPLELDLPERQIVLSDEGRVQSVAFKERLDAHRLIEEFMVLANVAAAETLIAKRTPLLFRVHEEPASEKLDALREVAGTAGLTLAKGQVLKTQHLNKLLQGAAQTDAAELINLSVLRSMTQAYYGPENLGHFGLALKAYAHFTSPIRRYADLVVHRALVRAYKWGDDGLTDAEIERLKSTAEQISQTERRSMEAERDTTDRYLAAFLSERIGAELTGRISGIQGFGVFVKLDETGADGLIPIRALGREYFHFDRDAQTLEGSDTGQTIGLGQRVVVRLAEAVPVTGGLMLELLELDGAAIKQSNRPMRRKTRGKPKKGSKKRSVSRRRK